MTTEQRHSLRNDLVYLRTLLEKQLGADHLEMIFILRPLAAQYVASSEHAEALPYQQQILRLCREHPDNPLLPTQYEARKAVAQSLQGLKQYREAAALYTVLLSQDDSAETAAALVLCLQGNGNWQEAVRISETFVARFEACGEESFGQQVSWIMRLSECYSKRGNYAKAAEIFERTVPIMAGKHELLCIPQLDFLADLYRKAKDNAAHERVLAKRRDIARRNDY